MISQLKYLSQNDAENLTCKANEVSKCFSGYIKAVESNLK